MHLNWARVVMCLIKEDGVCHTRCQWPLDRLHESTNWLSTISMNQSAKLMRIMGC